MCGIAGIMATEESDLDFAKLETMKTELKHRGPDGEAVWSKDKIGLVHTRLSIIDVENGVQPLFGPAGTVLVANGEIYNTSSCETKCLKRSSKPTQIVNLLCTIIASMVSIFVIGYAACTL